MFPLALGGVFRPDTPEEGQDGRGIVGHTMIWPGSEVILSYLQGSSRIIFTLEV